MAQLFIMSPNLGVWAVVTLAMAFFYVNRGLVAEEALVLGCSVEERAAVCTGDISYLRCILSIPHLP